MNGKWYFGHEVQVITFYLHPSASWCVAVYEAGSTRASASGTDGIHLYADSTKSLYKALEIAQWKLEERIGKMFRVVEGIAAPILEDSPEPCDCLPLPDLPRKSELECQNKIGELDARLQAVEDKLLHGDAGSSGGPSGSSGHEIGPALDKIERKLEAIEIQIQARAAETPSPIGPPAGLTIHQGTDISDTSISGKLATTRPVFTEAGRSIPPSAGPEGPGVGNPDVLRQ